MQVLKTLSISNAIVILLSACCKTNKHQNDTPFGTRFNFLPAKIHLRMYLFCLIKNKLTCIFFLLAANYQQDLKAAGFIKSLSSFAGLAVAMLYNFRVM